MSNILEEFKGRIVATVKNPKYDNPAIRRDDRGRWAPGQSGNPGGRFTYGHHILQEKAADHIDEVWEIAMGMLRSPCTKDSARVALIQTVFDRAAGRPVTKVEVDEKLSTGKLEQQDLRAGIALMEQIIKGAKSEVIEIERE